MRRIYDILKALANKLFSNTRWTDKDQSGSRHFLGKERIFGQEAVTGVDRLQVAASIILSITRYRRAGTTQQHRLVGLADMDTPKIGLRIDRHGANSHGLTGTDHMFFTYVDFVDKVKSKEALVKALNRMAESGRIVKLAKEIQ